jgi:hypothetical protein
MYYFSTFLFGLNSSFREAGLILVEIIISQIINTLYYTTSNMTNDVNTTSKNTSRNCTSVYSPTQMSKRTNLSRNFTLCTLINISLCFLLPAPTRRKPVL